MQCVLTRSDSLSPNPYTPKPRHPETSRNQETSRDPTPERLNPSNPELNGQPLSRVGRVYMTGCREPLDERAASTRAPAYPPPRPLGNAFSLFCQRVKSDFAPQRPYPFISSGVLLYFA